MLFNCVACRLRLSISRERFEDPSCSRKQSAGWYDVRPPSPHAARHYLQISRGKRKSQAETVTSPTLGSSSQLPESPSSGRWHIGLEHLPEAEVHLALLLEVFEMREAEIKEYGHASSEIPSAEIAEVLESIGVSCSSGELEALCDQLQHIAGRIGVRCAALCFPYLT